MRNYRSVFRAAAWVGAMLAPLGAGAQMGSGDGFLFGTPRVSITLHGGLAMPSAGSDVYAFVQKHLTLGRSDFAGRSLSADLAIRTSDRTAVLLSVGSSGQVVWSEYRDWVDNNDRPIEQSTALRRTPLTVGIRYYLTPPGRTLSRLAWVPARVVPYVAAGAGSTWYKFRQSGDFVDYKTLGVFGSTMESSAWTPTAYGAAGVDCALTARLGLVAEARYDLGSARMSSDFSGFNRIDLSGLAVTAGLTIRF